MNADPQPWYEAVENCREISGGHEGGEVSQHIIGTKQGRTVKKYLEDMKEGV